MSSAGLLALAGIFAEILGDLLYGAPKGPDVLQGWGSVAGVFLITAFVFCSQLSWGFLLARAWRREAALWERFFWGASLTMLILGTFGFVSVGTSLAWRIFPLAGCGGALWLSRAQPRARLPRLDPADLAAAAALLFAGLLAALPQPFWDSLWYHLTASRLWSEAGRIYLPPRLPIALQNGLWDYHFILGQVLLGGPRGGGLIAGQLFGQWLSVGTALFAFLLLRTEGRALGLSPFAAFVGLAGTEVFFEAGFAKNDWAVVFWSLAATVFLRNRRYLPAAFAAGLAFAVKLSAAIYLLPLGIWLIGDLRDSPRKLMACVQIALLASAPILLRNAELTGNPFFPAAAGLFPSSLQGPSWNGIQAYAALLPGPHGWVLKLRSLLWTSAGLLGLLAWPWARRGLAREAREPFVAAVFTVAVLLFVFGPSTEWRFGGAGVVLAAAYGGRLVEILLARLGGSRSRMATRAVLAACLAWFPIDWLAPVRLARAGDPVFEIRRWAAGGALAWARMNAASGTAATLNETKIYYLFPGEPRRAFDEPELDRRLAQATGAADLPPIFRKEGIRYLVLSAEFVDRAYDRRVCDWAYELSEKFPGAVAFRADLSRVLDLGKLP